MNGIVLLIVAVLGLTGCANEKKYELAMYRTTVAGMMYSDLQETRQAEAESKETVAMASMGFIEKGCGNECDKPKKKKAKEKVPKDCSKILERYDKNCDSAKSGSAHEEVCNELYSTLETEKKRCEGDSDASDSDNDNSLIEDEAVASKERSSTKTETVKVDQPQGDGEIKKAIAKATADSAGSTVINNFIGDNNTSGSYNPSASGAGSVVMGSGAEHGAGNLDAEAASILSLAGKDVDSDAKEVSDGYFKPTLDTAKGVAWPIAGAYVGGKMFNTLEKGFENAGDDYENVNNPDNSDNSTNIPPASDPTLPEE